MLYLGCEPVNVFKEYVFEGSQLHDHRDHTQSPAASPTPTATQNLTLFMPSNPVNSPTVVAQVLVQEKSGISTLDHGEEGGNPDFQQY